MPRETVFTPYPHDPESGPPPFQIQVGWQRDQDVQLGIATHDDRHLVDYIYGDAPTQTHIGRHLLAKLQDLGISMDLPDHEDSDTEAEFFNEVGRQVLDAVTGSAVLGTSVWATPGRSQINDLIRLLRKARDAAFGRDE